MSRAFRRVSFGVALTGLLFAVLPAPGAVAQGTEADSGIALPTTIAKVWYRAGQKKGLAGLRVFKAAGDLTLTEEGLEFLSGKDSFSIPLADITMVSLGKMGRDVDTDWAVLALREKGLERIIAFKDGKALGYGQDTPQIYWSIRAAMRKLGGAQFSAPPGYQPYYLIDDQVAFPYPDGWSVYMPSATTVGSRTPWGSLVFSSQELDGGPELAQGRAIRARIRDAGTREFFLLREEASPGMSCSGFKPKALAGLLDRAAGDPIFGEEFRLTEAPRSTPVTLGGCEGLRVLARGRWDDGIQTVVDLRMVAKRDTLFTFVIRAPDTGYDSLLELIEPVVAGVRFAPAGH